MSTLKLCSRCVAEGDMRTHFEKFKAEIFQSNLAVVEGWKTIAEKKGITPAQLCIAWVASLGPTMIPLPGSSYVFLLVLCLEAACFGASPPRSLINMNDLLTTGQSVYQNVRKCNWQGLVNEKKPGCHLSQFRKRGL